eukprot:TRINITY_DN22939_c0_g1_i1.p1 TRINITY_DN22939_c0_g1~~TRINITY_DN22939_c0_g1_i1.p1  ORF type:complete len:276 (-),score=25.25 TRINITY_DN22939_c0_g1_i1:1785-2612(-)
MEPTISAGSYIPIFFPAFIAMYLFGYFVVFSRWSLKHRPEASSCFISLLHGTPAAIMATFAIDPHSQPGFVSFTAYFQNLISLFHDIITVDFHSDPGFGSHNTNIQNLILDFSMSYFLVDLIHYIIFFPSDLLFIGHHLATLFVFFTCRYLVSHGAFALLVLLVLAEVTSFCQNMWTLANSRRADSPTAVKVYNFFYLPFFVLYTIVRGFLGPLFVYKMGVYYLSGVADDIIPRWISLSWIVVVAFAILGSLMWILNLWMELYRERIGRMEKKTR